MNMSDIATSMQLSDDEYLPIWSAMMETPRGRRFLSEFARRTRMAETRTLLDAVQTLEHALLGAREGQAGATTALPGASAAEAASRAELIAAAAQLREAAADSVQVLDCVSRINLHALGDLQAAADDIQAVSSALRSVTGPGSRPCNEIDVRLNDIREILSVQQIADDRTTRACTALADAVRHLDASSVVSALPGEPANAGYSGDAAPRLSDDSDEASGRHAPAPARTVLRQRPAAPGPARAAIHSRATRRDAEATPYSDHERHH